MVKKFILIRKKTSKNFIGAIPVRKGVTLDSIRNLLKRQLKKGYAAKIISATQLKSLAKKGIKSRSKKRK